MDQGVIDRQIASRAGTLRLRTLTPDDAEAFARHVAADRAHLREHLPWGDVAHEPGGARAWLGRYAEHADGRVLVAGAFASEEIVGGALLMAHRPEAAAVELGCWASSRVAGQGVAGAACAALLGYARDALRAERVIWFCTTDNRRSRALAERLGFRHEGTLRSAYVLRGERHDLDLLALVGAELDAFVAG